MLRSQGRRCGGRRVVVTGEGHIEVTGEGHVEVTSYVEVHCGNEVA